MTGALPQAVVTRLRCPACAEGVVAASEGVRCTRGHEWSTAAGYLDMSGDPGDEATARTLASFGYEWTTFDRVQPEDEGFWKWYFADVPLDELRGLVGLDAGCGKARYTRYTAAHLGTTVALDGSDAVDAAVRNLEDVRGAAVVKADLRSAPFADGSFDFVSCLGVLHHLPSPEEGFRVLVRLLAPGGRLLVYVYSRPSGFGVRRLALAAATAMRVVTTRIPHRLLRILAAPIAVALYAGVVVPGHVGARRGIARLTSLPLQTYRGRPLRSLWLDTFDRLSAPLEVRYRPDEIRRWFEESGLVVDACREDAGLFVFGRRPVA